MNGLRMKPFVAPTNCIDLMRKRWEYMASLMVLLINATDNITNITAKPRMNRLMEVRFWFIWSTKDCWNLTSLIIEYLSCSALNFSISVLLVYSAFWYTSSDCDKGL